ncbi:MAG TPA: family 16 glycoside hydrolase [Novimethylophilus sp.]|uniref:family 16 glycoside hydrolase n=1 Tax=Novimethylophilus sp. TaxID=2137426 RepID=UPI002F3FF5BE
MKKDVSLADGTVEVKFKSISGQEDQAGGLVWRWKDGNNYYVARANALENNISLYHTEDGSRKTIKYVDAPVSPNAWHTLKVTFSGKHITVALDGKTYIDLDDDHISGSGAVGVWTKADMFLAAMCCGRRRKPEPSLMTFPASSSPMWGSCAVSMPS